MRLEELPHIFAADSGPARQCRRLRRYSGARGRGGDAYTKEVTPANFGGQAAPARLKFVLSPRTPKAGDIVTLAVSMHLESGWHTYSTTQKDSPGSTTTKFKLTKGNGLQAIGESFQPDRAPEMTAKGSDGA